MTKKQLEKQIDKFCNLITEDNLPMPDSGDCWYCLYNLNEDDNSHLISHLEEMYLTGSLMVNAMREKGFNDTNIAHCYHLKLHDRFKSAVKSYLKKRLILNTKFENGTLIYKNNEWYYGDD